MFCAHKWKEMKRKFNWPINQPIKTKCISPEDFNRILFGITVVELKCRKCGMLRHITFVGDI